MSHISVRLTQAVAAVVAAVLVGGSTTAAPQSEEPVSQPQPATVQPLQAAKAPQQEVPVLEAKLSKCSAPNNGEGVSQLLVRLVKGIQPQIAEQELQDLTSDPGGSLIKDLRTNEQASDASLLNVADTVCVIRAANSASSVVWYTHMPGFKDSPTAYK